MAYRLNLINHGHNNNNYAEATFHVVKDIIPTRLKAYNPLALLDYIVVVVEKYYVGCLLSAAFGRLEKPYLLYQKIREKVVDLISLVRCCDSHRRWLSQHLPYRCWAIYGLSR
jgi:hypothetical protein